MGEPSAGMNPLTLYLCGPTCRISGSTAKARNLLTVSNNGLPGPISSMTNSRDSLAGSSSGSGGAGAAFAHFLFIQKSPDGLDQPTGFWSLVSLRHTAVPPDQGRPRNSVAKMKGGAGLYDDQPRRHLPNAYFH